MSKKAILLILGILLTIAVLKNLLTWINYDEYYISISILRFVFYIGLLGASSFYFIKKGKVILFNISVFAVLLFAVDFVFFFISGMPYVANRDFKDPNHEPDHIAYHMGHVPWPDSVLHDVHTNFDDTIFDSHYSIDELYRRTTPDFNTSKTKHAVFFGCSVGFGLGLEDHETLPFYFQSKTGDYNAYNYAFKGYGSNHMLSRINYSNFTEEIKEETGIGVYVFLWTHVRRNIGAMEVYTSWGHTMPYYTLEDGKVVNKGNFVSNRWLTSRLYEFLYWSYTARHFKVNLPKETPAEAYELTAAIIDEAKQRYLEQFKNDKFYVLIYPVESSEFTDENKAEILRAFDEKGLDYLNYDDAINFDAEHIIQGDGHPTKLSNQEISEMFIKDLLTK